MMLLFCMVSHGLKPSCVTAIFRRLAEIPHLGYLAVLVSRTLRRYSRPVQDTTFTTEADASQPPTCANDGSQTRYA